jgi:hypothetical protein
VLPSLKGKTKAGDIIIPPQAFTSGIIRKKPTLVCGMKSQTIYTKKGSLTLLEPGIIQFTLKENAEWNLEDAKETHRVNMQLSNGGKFCVYMSVTRFFIPTKEAQKFITTKECTDYRIGAAFVVRNNAVKIFANLFIKFFKSRTPTRLFSSEKDAMDWMRKILKESLKD